jgi:hypothetical protein
MAYINRDPEVPVAEFWQAPDESLQPALVVRSNATDAPALRVRGAGDLFELRDADDKVVYSIDQAGAPSGGVSSDDVSSIVTLTQAEYDELDPDPATLYIVTD